MTNQRQLIRRANALCKIIANARKELANPKPEIQVVRFAKALVAAANRRA